MPPQTDTLYLTLDGGSVMSAIQWLESLSARESWPSALTFALTISVDEALTNIESHAFRAAGTVGSDHRMEVPSAPCSVRLRCTSFSTQVRITIIDDGPPYDPTQAISPALPTSLEQAHIGGHGIRLMRHFLSDMSYRRLANENRLTFSINIVNHGSA